MLNGAAKLYSDHPASAGAGIGGACAVLTFYVCGQLGWNPPAEVASALTTVVSAVVVETGIRLRGRKP